MAFLVAPLAAGVVGAVSGTAELYGRGTTTPLFGYSASGAVIDKIIRLDANGGAEVYVGEPAFVRVRSSIGVVVREFVVGGDADVASPSFTGLLPSGSQGAGGVVGLGALFDRWHSSAGASDFLVRRPGIGVDETLTTALAAASQINQPFFNVRNYGAVGDGVADDTGAFVLAHDAAAATGGIIFVPGGNYLLTRPWRITNTRVSVMGAGCLATILTIGLATGTAITVNTIAPSHSGSSISDLTIATTVGGGFLTPLEITGSDGFILRNVVVDGFDAAVVISSRTIVENCEVYAVGGAPLRFDSGSAHSVVRGGTFLSARTVGGTPFVVGLYLGDNDITVIGAKVDLSVADVASGIGVLGTRCKVVDCDIIVGGGAASYGFYLATTSGFEFYENNNTIRGPAAGVHDVYAWGTGHQFAGYRGARIGRMPPTVITLSGTVLLDLDCEIQFLTYYLATSTTVTINAPASGPTGGVHALRPGLPAGSKLSLVISNAGTGSANIVLFGRPGVAVGPGHALLATFVWMETGAATYGMVLLHGCRDGWDSP